MKTDFTLRSLLENERERAISFIGQSENECTVLTEQILKTAENVFVLEDVLNSHFCALFYLRNNTTVFHFVPFVKEQENSCFHFSAAQTGEIENIILQFLQNRKIFCVYGEYSGTSYINSLLKKSGTVPVESREYILMEHDFENIAALEIENRADVCVRKCSIEDSDLLFELEKKYRTEEVVINNKDENEKIIRFVLSKSLMMQCVFCAVQTTDGKQNAVAKAGTNAKGKNYFQIGGVFCREEFRNKRIAFYVMQHLLRYIQSEQKKANLFVRIHNEPAKKLYRNLGFVETGKYLISYF